MHGIRGGYLIPDPNNIVIPEYKIIAFCIPKVANNSIKYAFMSALGMEMLNPSRAFRTCDKHFADFKHLWFSFSIVRNPFDRLVSCWAQKTQQEKWHEPFNKFGMWHEMPFSDFLDIVCCTPDKESNQHWRSQTHELMIGDKIVPDFIGRFETIEKDWEFIRHSVERRGLKLPELPHANKSEHLPYRVYYSPEMRDRVAKRYEKDLEVFGYEF